MERVDWGTIKSRLVSDKIDVAFLIVIFVLLAATITSVLFTKPTVPTTTTSAVKTATDNTLGGLLQSLSTPLQVTSTADVNRLPRPVEQNFKEYISAQIKADKPDRQGCIAAYYVSKISRVNVAGSVGRINPKAPADESNQCGKNQRVIWVQNDGVWQQLPHTEVPKCTELAGTNIYKEFIPYCNDGLSYGDQKDNPNGSIKDIKPLQQTP